MQEREFVIKARINQRDDDALGTDEEGFQLTWDEAPWRAHFTDDTKWQMRNLDYTNGMYGICSFHVRTQISDDDFVFLKMKYDVSLFEDECAIVLFHRNSFEG